MSKLSDIKVESESDDDSDWLSEEGPLSLRNLKRKRKMTRQSSRRCRNGSIDWLDSHQRRRMSTSSFPPELKKSLKEKTTLPVTCGNKEGILHKDKFNNSEPCILSGDQWFTPTQFECFGGKMRNKKWKHSICYNQIQLQALIQVGILSFRLFNKRRFQDKESECKKKLIIPRRSSRRTKYNFVSNSSLESDCSAVNDDDVDDDDNDDADDHDGDIDDDDNDDADDHDGDIDDDDSDDDVDDHDGHIDDDDSDDDVDDHDGDNDVQATEREFTGDSFKVICWRGKGVLHVNRFATETFGKCIRTHYAWLSPIDFLNKNKPGGNWRRDISVQGVALGELIMKRILKPHSVNCKCSICTGSPLFLLDQNNDDVCFKCSCDGDLVCCNECPRAFHHLCHNPAIMEESISEHWTCSFCKKQTTF